MCGNIPFQLRRALPLTRQAAEECRVITMEFDVSFEYFLVHLAGRSKISNHHSSNIVFRSIGKETYIRCYQSFGAVHILRLVQDNRFGAL